MDDFVLSNLHESKNEWCSRLVNIFTPLMIEGVRSIFNESWKMCMDNEEPGKYLMTFQNLIARVPKWNANIVEEERKRIVERSGCAYLEDLITCVHIIQLKVLTCVRVGNKQKKIDISIPNLDNFIHRAYINIARKCYTNVYLFEKNIQPLLIQRNHRELEQIVQECILITIRDSIPTEAIIRAYMDENVEQEEEVTIENIVDEPESEVKPAVSAESESNKNSDVGPPVEIEPEQIPVVPSIQNLDEAPVITKLSFNDIDRVMDMGTGDISDVPAPKDPERLEALSMSRAIQNKLDEENDMDDRIKIHTDTIDLGEMDFLDIHSNGKTPGGEISLDGIEELL